VLHNSTGFSVPGEAHQTPAPLPSLSSLSHRHSRGKRRMYWEARAYPAYISQAGRYAARLGAEIE